MTAPADAQLTSTELTPGQKVTPSAETTDKEFGSALVAMMSLFGLEGLTGYTGPVTHDVVVQAFKHSSDMLSHSRNAAAAAPSEAIRCHLISIEAHARVFLPRQNALPEFSPEDAFGKSGARLRDNIQRYSALPRCYLPLQAVAV